MTSRTRTKHPGISSYKTQSGTRYRIVAPGLVDPLTGIQGKQRTKAGFKTLDAAKTARAEMLAERTVAVALDWTVQQLADRWITELVESGEVAASSIAAYESALNTYWLPALGAMRARDVATFRIQEMIRAMSAAGAKPNTVINRFQPLRTMFGRALAWQVVTINPAIGVKVPRRLESPGRAWSVDEVKRIIAVLPPDDHGRFVEVLVTTGLRIGELIALRWEDVDLGTGVIAVRRTLSKTRDRKAIVRDGAKTRTGERHVLLLPGCTKLLRRQRETVTARREQDAQWDDQDLVFPSYHGKLITSGTPKNWLKAAADRAGVDALRVHDLRHTHATILQALGVEERIIEARLGHKRPGMTARYTHINVESQRGAIEALERVLYGQNDTRLTRRLKRVTVPTRKSPVRSQKRRSSRGSQSERPQ